MKLFRTAAALVIVLASVPLLRGQTYTTGFENPPFTAGSVQGQDGWGFITNSPTDGFIVAVPAGSPASFGSQALALRTWNSPNSGVANRLFSATIASAAGETGSTLAGVPAVSPRSTFQASLWYRMPDAPVVSTHSTGRFAELDPASKGAASNQPANRYAQVRLVNSPNTAAGLPRVEIGWYTNSADLNQFSILAVAANLQWGQWYRFEYLITLVDGLNGTAPNDRFRLSVFDIAGTQVGTGCGSTWEAAWKTGGFGGGTTPRAINGFDFWSTTYPGPGAPAEVPTVVGLIDNVSMTALTPAGGPLQTSIAGVTTVCGGGTVPLTASSSGASGTIESYAWRDATNALVGTAATLAAASGTYTVTVTDSSCATATSAPFTVTALPAFTVAISGTTSVCFGGAATITATPSGGSGTITGYTWRDAANNVVGNSAALTAGAGTYSVTVTDASCGAATATASITVTCKATPVVTWSNPANITYGTPLGPTQLNATASVPGSFVYHPPAGTILDAGANQVLSVDFTPSDTTNYNSVNGTTVVITVDKLATSTVITSAMPAPSRVGKPVVVTVAVSSSYGTPGGTITIQSGGQSCTATTAQPSCALTFSTSGRYLITATYGGDSNFLPSTSAPFGHNVQSPAATATVSGSTSLCGSGSAVLSVSLTGSGPWTITWSDGVVETVDVATHSRTVAVSKTTSFSIASVTDRNGAGTSLGAAVITVVDVTPPEILDNPPVEIGMPLTLRATAGYASYQWYLNGHAIAGATSSVLFIASVSAADAGTYTVTGTRDGCASDASQPFAAVPAGDAVIPVVGTVRGANGSLFRTTVHLANGTGETLQGEITFIDGSLPKVPFVLRAGETQFLETLLPPSFSGLTSANVHALSGPLPIVVAHVYDDQGDRGTSGMIERAIPLGSALRAGDRAVLVTPSDPVEARFNVGMRSLAEGLSVRVIRRSSDGRLLGTQERTLAPSTLVHQPVAALIGESAGSSESLTFEVTAGRGVIYGAATDNRTNDPNMQIATRLGVPNTSGRFVLPVAGAVNGAFGSRFVTELQIHNPSDQPVAISLAFHAAGVSATPADPSIDLTVAPLATLAIDDIVSSMGSSGLGSLDLVTRGSVRPVALARVYSVAESGQTSLMTELVAEEDALHSGERGVVVAPHSPGTRRFNIGVRSLGSGAKITATVRNAAGDTVHTAALSFPAAFFNQAEAGVLLGRAFTGDESVVLNIDEGQAVIYGVWTDNVTQDPAMQYAVRP